MDKQEKQELLEELGYLKPGQPLVDNLCGCKYDNGQEGMDKVTSTVFKDWEGDACLEIVVGEGDKKDFCFIPINVCPFCERKFYKEEDNASNK